VSQLYLSSKRNETDIAIERLLRGERVDEQIQNGKQSMPHS
jgi:hypothetical protein